MELRMVHLLATFMILTRNCHGRPIKKKVIGKLSEEALAADASTSSGSQPLSLVKFRSKRSTNVCTEKDGIFTPLIPNLRRMSDNVPIPNIFEIICTCKEKQKYVPETVCLWKSDTCSSVMIKMSGRDATADTYSELDYRSLVFLYQNTQISMDVKILFIVSVDGRGCSAHGYFRRQYNNQDEY